jgi:hypothetical protein
MDKERQEKENSCGRPGQQKGQSVEVAETNLTLIVSTRETQFFEIEPFQISEKWMCGSNVEKFVGQLDVETSYYWAARNDLLRSAVELIGGHCAVYVKTYICGVPSFPSTFLYEVKRI